MSTDNIICLASGVCLAVLTSLIGRIVRTQRLWVMILTGATYLSALSVCVATWPLSPPQPGGGWI
jgi:drug/metabolite transporter (DMT)-like permease